MRGVRTNNSHVSRPTIFVVVPVVVRVLVVVIVVVGVSLVVVMAGEMSPDRSSASNIRDPLEIYIIIRAEGLWQPLGVLFSISFLASFMSARVHMNPCMAR